MSELKQLNNENSSLPTGLFISFEGIEGMGKTTMLRWLSEYLHEKKFPLLITREPGGTPLSDDIRHFLLSQHAEPIEAETELLMLFAARVQHLKRLIIPALEAGKLVLCDRFTDTTYAYQGAGRRISFDKIKLLESLIQGDLKPHLTILFNAPIHLGLSRISARKKKDRFESEEEAFFQRAQEAYLKMAELNPERIKIIDASKSILNVREQILSILNSFLEKTSFRDLLI